MYFKQQKWLTIYTLKEEECFQDYELIYKIYFIWVYTAYNCNQITSVLLYTINISNFINKVQIIKEKNVLKRITNIFWGRIVTNKSSVHQDILWKHLRSCCWPTWAAINHCCAWVWTTKFWRRVSVFTAWVFSQSKLYWEILHHRHWLSRLWKV